MVHTFSALGRNLAVDVNSGAVHVLDKLCCDLLSLVEGPMGDACPQDLKDRLSQYDARELDEAWTELLELQRAGLLFSDDDYIDPAGRHGPAQGGGGEGTVSACLPRLQPALPLLLCLYWRLRYRTPHDHGL